MCELDAVILASGASRRMGENKLLLPLGDMPVIELFLTNFPYELFHTVCLVVADEGVATIGRKFPLTLCRNDRPGAGKSHSIRLGLDGCSAGDGMLFAVADQPFLPAATVAKLVDVFRQDRGLIVLPQVNNMPRNPVVFPACLRRELQALRGDAGGRLVIRNHPELVRHVIFEDESQFLDIDTPDMYRMAKKQWMQKEL
jgi:molybdenum cofactor cytidylyltransferase